MRGGRLGGDDMASHARAPLAGAGRQGTRRCFGAASGFLGLASSDRAREVDVDPRWPPAETRAQSATAGGPDSIMFAIRTVERSRMYIRCRRGWKRASRTEARRAIGRGHRPSPQPPQHTPVRLGQRQRQRRPLSAICRGRLRATPDRRADSEAPAGAGLPSLVAAFGDLVAAFLVGHYVHLLSPRLRTAAVLW
jgi:hypothetical protein